jgi:quinolinate synthase
MEIQEYQTLSDAEVIQRIQDLKKELGRRLLILAHNYQRHEVYSLGDFTGDSLELSRKARDAKEAEFIVFSAVRFMAETARILAQDRQRVFLPHRYAGCPMADMGELVKAEAAWQAVQKAVPGAVIPIVYVNSDADLKAFCGREGGACVTSGNAPLVFKWAYQQKKCILFFPDEHLGRNTANILKVPETQRFLWDPDHPDGRGGLSKEDLTQARLILWKGYCHVHVHFTKDQISRARAEHPKALVLVHPECREEVAKLADFIGSTKMLQDFVAKAPRGAELVIGTEANFIKNLSREHPDKKLIPLSPSLCPNMYKTSLKHLLFTLENLPKVNEITLEPGVIREARLALERMFQATEKPL